MFERKSHWQNIYTQKAPTEVSWYQPRPEKSLELIARTRVEKSAQIIDVGGGASTLVDTLLAQGFQHITVLDIASAAIERAKARLGEQTNKVTWLEADITLANLPPSHYDVWHDRAVFHFLTDASDRKAYVTRVGESLKSSGHLIIATFAPDGPLKCSGLNVVRYGPEELRGEFGDEFQLIDSVSEIHQTPFKIEQKFTYCYLKNGNEREGSQDKA